MPRLTNMSDLFITDSEPLWVWLAPQASRWSVLVSVTNSRQCMAWLTSSTAPHVTILTRFGWERCLQQVRWDFWQDTNVAVFRTHSAAVPTGELCRTCSVCDLSFSRIVTKILSPASVSYRISVPLPWIPIILRLAVSTLDAKWTQGFCFTPPHPSLVEQ